jgi:periplasmic protein CpxP/Spy
MNQIKFYKFAIGVLVLLNLSILAFFLFSQPKPPQHRPFTDFREEVIKSLKLEEHQADNFKRLATEHHQKMEKISRQQQQLLIPYFKSLSYDDLKIDKTSILDSVEVLEREKITITQQHLQEIKSSLSAEQIPLFKEFIDRFIENILGNNKNNPPPPKEY